MAVVRLAHFSDIHFTVPPWSLSWRLMAGKRLAGALNYYVGGRGERFLHSHERIARLLDDVDTQHVDHALCTGDVTAIGAPVEFDGCARLFGERLRQPERFTVIPGNHDRYTRDAVEDRLFERHFGPLADDGHGFPVVKQAAPGLTLVALDVSRPTAVWDSSGLCGPAQLRRARELLTEPSLDGQFVVLALHYGLLRADGRRDRRSHALRDDEALLAMLADPRVHVDLVVHGHMHRPYRVNAATRPVMCVGSATDLLVGCGYNVYEIDLERRAFTVFRRAWHPASGAYVASPVPPELLP